MKYHLDNARRIAELLDGKFKIFDFRFGIDPLLGLLPGSGDMIATFLSLYLLYIGIRIQVPRPELMKMVANIGFDLVLGVIPVAGDVGDFFFKASERNFKILEKYADSIKELKT